MPEVEEEEKHSTFRPIASCFLTCAAPAVVAFVAVQSLLIS